MFCGGSTLFLLGHNSRVRRLLSLYILYVMMFLVGIGLGSDLTALSAPIKKYKFQILLIPLSTIVGTIVACCLFSLFCPVPLRETVAIGCGFGYYSLSAILLNELAGADIGTTALICNLSRELLTLLTIPLLARYCGKLAPITAAGATSIDTTLPLISAALGEKYVIFAIFHGIIVDISVPVLIWLLYL